MQRAYSVFNIKRADDEKRVIAGIATTPAVDRMDDIVESDGAEFSLPLPFLLHHNAALPIGQVTKAKAGKSGITVEVQLAKTDEPGPVKDRLDAAWQDIKLGLIRGLSIGFKALETARIEGTYGLRFIRWQWLELSAVTIAANQDATITAIKSADRALRIPAPAPKPQRKTIVPARTIPAEQPQPASPGPLHPRSPFALF